MKKRNKGLILSFAISAMMICLSVCTFGLIKPMNINTSAASLPSWAPLVTGVFGAEGQMSQIKDSYDFATNVYTYADEESDKAMYNWQYYGNNATIIKRTRTFVNYDEIALNSDYTHFTEYGNGSQVMLHNYETQYNSQAEIEPYIVDDQYTSYTTTEQYVGKFILDDTTYKEVKNTNHSSLGITAGTTKAYIQRSISTFYMGIGYDFLHDGTTGSITKTNNIVTSLDVQLYLSNDWVVKHASDFSGPAYSSQYGGRIKINQIKTQTVYPDVDEPSPFLNHYWYQYLDLSAIEGLTNISTGQTINIKQTEGLYTLVFTMNYGTYNQSTDTFPPVTIDYVYQVYLFGDNSYIEYPVFNGIDSESKEHITEYAKSNAATDSVKSPATEFYNYQTEELPTLLYNATKYNVGYIHEYTDTKTYTTNFYIDNGVGVLTTFKSGAVDSVTHIKIYDEFGEYLNDGAGHYVIEYWRNNSLFAKLTLNTESYDTVHIPYANNIHTLYVVNDVRQQGIKICGVANTTPDYYYFMQFEDLGNYTLNYHYLLKLGDSNWIMLDETPTDFFLNKYIDGGTFNSSSTKELLAHGIYSNGAISFDSGGGLVKLSNYTSSDVSYDYSADGRIELRVFGVRPTFYKSSQQNSTKYYMQDSVNGIYADQTEYVANAFAAVGPLPEVNLTKSELQGVEFYNVPKTDLQPIYMDYWGKYTYLSAGPGTNKQIPKSKICKIERGKYTVSGTAYTIADELQDSDVTIMQFGKDTKIPVPNSGDINGLYIMVVDYTYEQYNNLFDGNNPFRQIIVFEINNLAPALDIYTKDSGNTNPDEPTPLAGLYTNDDTLYAHWEEPNYFQGQIYTSIEYFEYTTTGVKTISTWSTNNYQKDTPINLISGKTREGKYLITIHYGLDSANNKTIQAFVDRTAPTATRYKVGSMNKSTVKFELFNDVLNDNITTEKFVLISNKKPSGAAVSITYRTIPFSVNENYFNVADDQLYKYKFVNGSYQGVVIKDYVNTTNSLANTTTSYLFTSSYYDDERYGETVTVPAVNKGLVFGASGSAIYVVTIVDQAGNSQEFYYIYDISTPYVVVTNAVTGEYINIAKDNVVKTNTNIFFGDYKIVAFETNDYIADFYDKINGSDAWHGSRVLRIGDNYYLAVPLANAPQKAEVSKTGTTAYATPNNNSVKDVTIFKKQSVAEYQAAANLQPWTVSGGTKVTLFCGEGTYIFSVNDTLNNQAVNSKGTDISITLSLDNARLSTYISDWISETYDYSTNKKPISRSEENLNNSFSYNTHTLQLTYVPTTQIGSAGDEVEVGVRVSYDYYPFSFDNYLKKDIEYPNFVNPDEDYFYPNVTYPLSITKSKNYTFTTADIELFGSDSYGTVITKEVLNKISGGTAEGLYVVKREYTGITEDAFNNSGEEDDAFIRYFVIYIDRNAIIYTLSEFNSTSQVMEVNHVMSIGDLIQVLLGAGTDDPDYISTITSGELYELRNSEPMFTTNKVKFNLSTPSDKWTTEDKLLNLDLTDYTRTSTINSAINYNSNTFKLRINLSKIVQGSGAQPVKVELITDRDGIVDANTVEGNLRSFYLIEEGRYQITLFDNSGPDGSDNLKLANQFSFTFVISYDRPKGQYNTVIEENKIDLPTYANEIPLGYPTTQFNATNKKVLEFNYSDSLSEFAASVDTSYILVESVQGNWTQNTNWTRIFSMDGETVFNPRNVDIDAIWQSIEIGDTGKFTHYLTIFNYDNPNNLADYTADASYKVTLRFKGDAEYYITANGDSYYTNSFVIYADHKNPEENLNWLKANDKIYNGEDTTEFYFAVNNGEHPTIFEQHDRDESYRLYFRQLGSSYPDSYYPSIVNDEERIDPQQPVFSEFSNLYVGKPYNNDYIFSFQETISGYYEIVECDQAGNATVYLVYVSNNDSRTLELTTDPELENPYVAAGGEIAHNIQRLINIEYNNPDSTDLYGLVKISSAGTLLATLRNTSNDYHTINDWLQSVVVSTINQLNEDNSNLFTFNVEVVNRFGNNYNFALTFPGNELKLIITENNTIKTITVVIPAKSRDGVNINEFNAYLYNEGMWETQTSDASGQSSIIDTYNTDRTTPTTYVFTAGLYKFTTTDNFNRKQTYYAVVGNTINTPPTFNYGDSYYESNSVVYTSGIKILNGNQYVTMIVSKDYWQVDLFNNNGDPLSGAFYTSILNSQSRITTYKFEKTDFVYVVKYKWAYETSYSGEQRFKIIDKTPKADLIDINGSTLQTPESSILTYTKDFYILFDNSIDVDHNLFGTTATLTLDNKTISINSGYLVDKPGTYTLTLTNLIGAKTEWTFTRDNNNFTYYSVKIEETGKLVPRSEYTTINADDNASIHHYFVLNEEGQTPVLVVDSNNGYYFEEAGSGASFDRYRIYKTSGVAICYVQINKIDKNSNFGTVDVRFDNESITSTQTMWAIKNAFGDFINSVTIGVSSNSISSSGKVYNVMPGNFIFIDYYYNNTFVRTLSSSNINDTAISFTFTRAGLHSFKVRDLAGNQMIFGLASDTIDIFLINDLVYTINNDTPIQNMVYNGMVDINIIDFKKQTLYTNINVEVTRNGESFVPLVLNGTYRFTSSGYYVVTMSAKTQGDIVVRSTYNFVITYNDNAHLSFSIPSSYNFTMQSIYLYNADVTDRFPDNSSLWLSIGSSGSGLFTVNATYYIADENKVREFSFKIWINEDIPSIIPLNYTYGTKTTKEVKLQYNGHLIYEQMGNARVVLVCDGKVVYNGEINFNSSDTLSTITIPGTRESAGTYYAQIYDANDRLIVSYKIVKTVPLNSSAVIIIIIASAVVLTGVVIFIILRRHTRFK